MFYFSMVRSDYGLLLELNTLTLVARSYALLVLWGRRVDHCIVIVVEARG